MGSFLTVQHRHHCFLQALIFLSLLFKLIFLILDNFLVVFILRILFNFTFAFALITIHNHINFFALVLRIEDGLTTVVKGTFISIRASIQPNFLSSFHIGRGLIPRLRYNESSLQFQVLQLSIMEINLALFKLIERCQFLLLFLILFKPL